MPMPGPVSYVSDRVRFDKDGQRMIATRKLRQSGSSMVVSIPPQILDASGLEAGDELAIVADVQGHEIVLSRIDRADIDLLDEED